MIAGVEEDLSALTQRLCEKLLAHRSQDKTLNLLTCYSNLSADFVSRYAFGEDFGLLAQSKWSLNVHETSLTAVKNWYTFRFFPILRQLVKAGLW